ncbi:MAG TPA: FAD-dependent oxidoreductase [Solirubrobacteraceae bacterium]|nr:FAD-dependent oxidoreductase [Solirubrobacteraceae bacterium]
MDRLVIVGASLAGLRAAQAARAGGHQGELVVIGDEARPPYTRPPLSKELLSGGQTPEQCALPHPTLEASWRLGSAARGLDRSGRQVILADGDKVDYERLIIATGCRARDWTGPGADLEGVHTLRRLDDSLALRAALAHSRHLVIVGAGFIGCEVAATARKQGVPVTLLDIAPHPLLALGPELGARCAQMHRDHGVDVRCGTSIEAILGQTCVEGVQLDDGTELAADVVLLALGAQPNTEWLRDSGLELNAGVVCDPTLTSSVDPDILAAGDVTEWPHRLAGGAIVRVEHWTTAAEQGQLAGRNALLDPAQRAPHEAPPYFWSDQYDTKIQSVGFPALAPHLEILEEEPEEGRLVATGSRDGHLVAAVTFNAAKRLIAYRRELAAPAVGAAG